MRLILILFFCLSVNVFGARICSRSLTIDHTKVPSTQTNFTVLVSVTDAGLKTVANGGHVQNSSGFDIGFFSDSGGTTALKWEVEKYDATTGNLVAWVKIASLSSSSDTVFYLFYDDATISTDQSDPANTWDSSYICVWHMNDNAASTTILKSTSTGANATNNANTSGKTATGQVASALTYNGTTDGAAGALDLSSTMVVTLSFWMKWTTNADDDDLAFEFTTNYNAGNAFIADWNAAGGTFTFGSHENPVGHWTDDFTRPSAGSWHHIALVMDKTTTPVNKAYVDGSAATLTANLHAVGARTNAYDNSTLYFMSRAAASLNGDGVLDEVRVSTIERSADWITANYNNQNSPSTFMTMASESCTGGSTPVPSWFIFFQ